MSGVASVSASRGVVARVVRFDVSNAQQHMGEEAVSEWVTLTQELINSFATATMEPDLLGMHTDEARARAGPFGCTLVFGYQTLSLLTGLQERCLWPTGAWQALNYGLERVRFVAPVPVGARLRLRTRIARVERKRADQVLIGTDNVMEMSAAHCADHCAAEYARGTDDAPVVAMVATALGLWYQQSTPSAL